MKINIATHLAEQLELKETHLLIHMVAQSDMTATPHRCLVYKFN